MEAQAESKTGGAIEASRELRKKHRLESLSSGVNKGAAVAQPTTSDRQDQG